MHRARSRVRDGEGRANIGWLAATRRANNKPANGRDYCACTGGFSCNASVIGDDEIAFLCQTFFNVAVSFKSRSLESFSGLDNDSNIDDRRMTLNI